MKKRPVSKFGTTRPHGLENHVLMISETRPDDQAMGLNHNI